MNSLERFNKSERIKDRQISVSKRCLEIGAEIKSIKNMLRFLLRCLFKRSPAIVKKLNLEIMRNDLQKNKAHLHMIKNLDPGGKMFQMNVYFCILIRGKCKRRHLFCV